MSDTKTSAPDGASMVVVFDADSGASKEEAEHLQTEDKQGALTFVDASAADFSQADYDCSKEDFRTSICFKDTSGKCLTGPEALATAYEAIGLGSYFRFTRAPGLTGSSSGFRV